MNQEIEAAIELGRALRAKTAAEYENEERQREYRQRQEIMEKWAPFAATLRRHVPEWATITFSEKDEPTYTPGNSYDIHYRPLTITVAEDIPPIRAWSDGANRITFSPGRWRLYSDEFTDGWIVTAEYHLYALTVYQMNQAKENEFIMTLAEAADQAPHYYELFHEAQIRNAAIKEKEEMESGMTPPIADPMERIADYLGRIASLYGQHHRF